MDIVTIMGRYQVSTRSGESIEVSGNNWLVALGLGLDALGVVASIDRLACEVLLGGKVIVRDVRAGNHFVVEALSEADEPLVEIDVPDEPEELLEAFEDEDSVNHAVLMPVSAEELALFDFDAASEHVHVTTGAEIVALPEDEELALPEEESEELDARIAALLIRIEESATTFDAWKLSLEGACRVIGAESGAALCREEDSALRFLFAVGPRAHEVLGRRLPPGQGIAGFCIQRDVGLLITEPSRDPRFCSQMDQTTGYTTTSLLAVPVGTDDEILGCLELLNAPGGFHAGQLGWLSALAEGLADRLAYSR